MTKARHKMAAGSPFSGKVITRLDGRSCLAAQSSTKSISMATDLLADRQRVEAEWAASGRAPKDDMFRHSIPRASCRARTTTCGSSCSTLRSRANCALWKGARVL